MKATGSSDAEILQQLLISTPIALHGRYLTSGRYYTGVKRVHPSSSTLLYLKDMQEAVHGIFEAAVHRWQWISDPKIAQIRSPRKNYHIALHQSAAYLEQCHMLVWLQIVTRQ